MKDLINAARRYVDGETDMNQARGELRLALKTRGVFTSQEIYAHPEKFRDWPLNYEYDKSRQVWVRLTA